MNNIEKYLKKHNVEVEHILLQIPAHLTMHSAMN